MHLGGFFMNDFLAQYDAFITASNVGTLAALAIASLMTWLCMLPIGSFWRRGWGIKRDDVLSSLDTHAKDLYFQIYLPNAPDDDDAETRFKAMYNHRYGLYRLFLPSVFLFAVLFPETFLIAETALSHLIVIGHDGTLASLTGDHQYITLPDKAVAALMGAYTWVVFSLITGACTYNMPPAQIMIAALRMVVAVPLGYAFALTADTGAGAFMAFAISAFPLATVQMILQRIANKWLKLDMGVTYPAKDDQVTRLDGIDQLAADRLGSADISTVAQLAYCDPVQVSLRTNFNFDYIVDIVDQALAWTYVGERINNFRSVGLRGALDIKHLLDDMRSGDSQIQKPAELAFAAAVAIANTTIVASDPKLPTRTLPTITADGLEHAFESISLDTYTEFLGKVRPRANPDPQWKRVSSVPGTGIVAQDGLNLTEKPTKRSLAL